MPAGMDLVWGWTDEDEARARQQMGLAARVNLQMHRLFYKLMWWFDQMLHVTGMEKVWTLYKLKLGGAMAAG